MTGSVFHGGLAPSDLPATGPAPAGDSDARVSEACTPPSVAEVYETHASYVFRCLRSLGIRESHVEDAVQDVFIVVNDKLASFDGKAKLRTWLYAITIRVARRYRERQAREPREVASEPIDSASAEQRFLANEQLALAHAALSALSEDKREVFVLAEVEQLSAPEIAAITFTPLNTVYSRLRAGRLEFDRRIAQLLAKNERRSR